MDLARLNCPTGLNYYGISSVTSVLCVGIGNSFLRSRLYFKLLFNAERSKVEFGWVCVIDWLLCSFGWALLRFNSTTYSNSILEIFLYRLLRVGNPFQGEANPRIEEFTAS